MSIASSLSRWPRWAIALGIAVVITLFIWNPFGLSTRYWTEDVLLDDGSMLVIKRTVKFTESNSWSGDVYNSTERASTLTFTGALASLPPWSVPLRPMVLYRDATKGNQWVIVATTTTCDVWNARGEPRPPYWEFRLGAQGWQEVPLSPSSYGRQTNLYTGNTSLDELYDAHHVPLGEARAYVKDADEQYRHVWLQAKSNCYRATKYPPKPTSH
jgi:hypothetical protein